MFKKTLSLLLSVGMMSFVLIGFAVSADNTASNDTTANTTIFGQVTAIDGNQITLALAEKPDNASTPPPTDTSSDTTTGSKSTASTANLTGNPASSDTSTAATASDTASVPQTPPSSADTSANGQKTLTLTGESQTITVADSTTITKDDKGQSSAATLSDITVGSFLTVTLSGSTVSAISIGPSQNDTPGQGNQQAAVTNVAAQASSSAVTVNGTAVSFQSYNINGNTYFKLRDIAASLNGTDKQFAVGYDSTQNAITLTSSTAYTSVGNELTVSDSSSSAVATPSSAAVFLDNNAVSLTAYTINGYTYFKLRDLASSLNFGVTWDNSTNTIGIDTTTKYTA